MNTKICGITTVADGLAAAAVGADFLGLNFSPMSVRHVRLDQALLIVTALRDARITALIIGVFVDVSPDEVAAVMADCHLDAAQLHGNEPPEALGLGKASPLRGRAFKAIRPRSAEEASRLADKYALPPSVHRGQLPALLVDTYDATCHGGTGRTGDWTMAAALARCYPIMLAGGLSPTNVGRAVREVAPWAVDVASGVEVAPRQKDPGAMLSLVRAVCAAGD